MNKPDIVRVIEERAIQLRRCGRELLGLCPFHAEKTPSFFVNPDKQLFLCRGCQAGSDVITFVELFDNVDFKTACETLKLEPEAQLQKRRVPKEAADAANWANRSFLRAQAKLRDLNGRVKVAAQAKMRDEVDQCVREFQILSIISDDLSNVKTALATWRDADAMAWVENVLQDAQLENDSIRFPPLTEAYQKELAEKVRGG